MTIEFRCPTCAKVLKTTDDKAGRKAACPGCGEALTVPGLVHAGGFEADEPRESSPPEPQPATTSDPFDSAFGAPAPRRNVDPGTAWHTPPAGPVICDACAETVPPETRGSCPFCGEPLRPARRRPLFAAHRGGLILGLGIAGWIPAIPFWACGIIAWVLANYDLKEMDEGRMDPSGRGLTSTGRIIAISSFVVYGLVIVGMITLFVAIAVMDAN